MGGIARDFISEERRDYKFKMGTIVASSLTGFIAGAISASIFWSVAMVGLFQLFESTL